MGFRSRFTSSQSDGSVTTRQRSAHEQPARTDSFAGETIVEYPKAASVLSKSGLPTLTDSPHVDEYGDELKRRLGNREVQLLAIGGAIGTGLFVAIGNGLYQAGPAGLFLGWTIYSIMVGLVNNCAAEMSTYMPVAGGFPKLAGHWVDDAFGFMAGYNFFFQQALLIPFEITALCTVLSFWRDDIPAVAVICVSILLYAIINVVAVRAYGEAEFWLSSGKVILIFVLFSFTFITMVGGNPKGDAYGFRYWNTPGPFAEHLGTGNLGKFQGFLAALWNASFAVTGPEFITLVAAETKHPRIYLKSAFKNLYWRFAFFFVLSSLCIGIVISHRDPALVAIVTGKNPKAEGTGAASPYIIAMVNLGIIGLPNLINALLLTSIFSAGNTYTFCATRTLYGLALEGRAPSILTVCTKSGVPILCFAVVMLFPCLAFLQLGHGSSVVLRWFINLTSASALINYITITTTYVFFYRACKAQNLDRAGLPYTGYFQPYSAYIGLVWMVLMVTCYGYSSFKPWNVGDFFTYYTMVFVAIILFTGYKLIVRTNFVKPSETDLVWELPLITEYENTTLDPITTFWREMADLFTFRRRKTTRRTDDTPWTARLIRDIKEFFELSDRTKADLARRRAGHQSRIDSDSTHVPVTSVQVVEDQSMKQ